MSTFQVIGVVAGLCAGIIWENLATSKFGHFYTLIPSMFVKEGGTTYHLHHWVLYALTLVVIIFLAYKTDRLTHPAILFLLGGFFGGILVDALSFRDFAIFVVSRTKISSKK